MRKFQIWGNINSRSLTTTLLVITLLLLNWVSYGAYIRFDLSRSGRLRLTSATKDILRKLPEPVILEAYFSEEVPESHIAQIKMLRDFLNEYEAASGGNVVLRFTDPDKDEDAKERANKFGIQPIDLGMIGDKGTEIKRIYLSVVILYGDQKEVLPSVLKSTSLEYEITSRIYKMVYPGERKIALAVNLGNLKLSDDKDPFSSLNYLNMGVDPLYGGIKEVDLNNEDVPADVTVLIIPTPSALSDFQKFRIDQFILRGGNVFLLAGGTSVNFYNGMAAPVSPDALEFFKHYGISAAIDMVVEPKNYMPIRNRVNLFQVQEIPYPYWVLAVEENINQDSLITKDLQILFFPWASTLSIYPDSLKGIDSAKGDGDKESKNDKPVSKVLVTSSEEAWSKTGTIFINPQAVQAELNSPANRALVGKKNLAVYIQGKFKSYFADKKRPDEKAPFIAQSEKKSTIIAVSSPYFLSDSALQMSKLANMNFALAAFDVMNGLDELVGARKKKISVPAITGEITQKEKTILTWLNFLVPLMGLAIYGFLRFRKRKKLSGMTYPGLEKA